MDTRSTTVAAPGRRDRNKQRIRERIYEAALELFAGNGYDATSVDAIADRADVARGTFFNHFPRKEDLIAEWGMRRRERLLAYLEESLPVDSGEYEHQLERCMEALSQINEEQRDTTPALLHAWVQTGRPLTEEPYAAEIFADVVESGRARGEFAADVNAARVGNILRDGYLGTLYRWSRDMDATPLHQELRAVLNILINGIRTCPAPLPLSAPDLSGRGA
jgi:TetR/AcrR family transcriptional regulator, cholesterol catabolism regulator